MNFTYSQRSATTHSKLEITIVKINKKNLEIKMYLSNNLVLFTMSISTTQRKENIVLYYNSCKEQILIHIHMNVIGFGEDSYTVNLPSGF